MRIFFVIYLLFFLVLAIALVLNHQGFALMLSESLFWAVLIGLGWYLFSVKRNMKK